MKEVLKLDKKIAIKLVYDYYTEQDYILIDKQWIEEFDWRNSYDVIIQRVSDKKYFKGGYREGRDEQAWEFEEFALFREVEKKEKVIYIYE